MINMIAGKVIILVLLSIFLCLNAMVLWARFTIGTGSSLWRRISRIEIPENEKKRYEPLYTLSWTGIGLWAFWKLKNTTLLGATLGFFAFRSGSNLSKMLAYTLHDQRAPQGVLKRGRTYFNNRQGPLLFRSSLRRSSS